MSNTGYKGISASLDRASEVQRYQVFVGWKGEERRRTLWSGDIAEALIVRAEFERELDKPRTEIRILPGEGVSYDARDRANGSAVWTARVTAQGVKRSTNFSILKHGYWGARRLAYEWRERTLRGLIESIG